MAKAPAFQFYTGDWMKDPELRSVSLEARGLWVDLLCLMWDSVERGYLVARNSLAFRSEHIARMVGAPEGQIVSLINELEETGVFSRDYRGAIYCRRMVRDAQKAAKNAENGRKGGQRKAENARNSLEENTSETVADSLANDVAKASPSSSSSSSTSVNKERGGETSSPAPAQKRFKRPELQDLRKEFEGKGLSISEALDQAERFQAHYDSNGWKVGWNSMQDWKAAVRTWMQKAREFNERGTAKRANGAPEGSKAVYTLKARQEAIEKEIKTIDNRTSVVATGPLYSAEDKKRRKELSSKLGKLNQELANV